MDIGDLIKGAPDLIGGLQNLGLSDDNVGDLGREIGGQLTGGDGFDLTDLLSGFDADSFLSQIDVAALSSKLGISPEIASAAVGLIAPKIAEFTGGGGGSQLGGLMNMAKNLFGKS